MTQQEKEMAEREKREKGGVTTSSGEVDFDLARSTSGIALTIAEDGKTIEDPSLEKYKTLSPVFTLDFPLSLLLSPSVHLGALKHMGWLTLESMILAGFGILFLFALSEIPFTRGGDTIDYYDPMLVAFFFFLTMFLVVAVIGYGFFVLIYGFKLSIPLIWWTVLPGSFASCLFFIFTAAGVQPWFYILDMVFYGVIGLIFYNSARVMANIVFPPENRGEKDAAYKKQLIMAYTLPLGIHVAIIALYVYVIIPYYRVIESEFARSIFRVIVHPLLCQINYGVASFFAKQYPKVTYHLTIGVVFGIWVETAMFGRFLISTVGTFEGTLGTATALGIVEIVSRACTKKKEHIFNYVFYRLTGKIEYDEKKELKFIAEFNNGMMVVDKIGIFVVPFMLHFFYRHKLLFNFSYGTTEISPEALFKSGAAQFCIDLVVHYVSIVVETNLEVPDVKVWWKHRGVYIIWEVLNYIQILTLVIYVFKTLPMAFYCTSTDPCSCHKTGYQALALFNQLNLCPST